MTKTVYSGRFLVGIDLGTTNCSVTYVDFHDVSLSLCPFRIPQLIAPGEFASEPLLPSFCYLAGEHDLPPQALELPWDKKLRHAVGYLARAQGALLPERLVSSAKSWLAHAGVDRQKPILPWGSDLGALQISPVQATFHYLDHIRAAWDQQFGKLQDLDGTACKLSEQQVVVTIPASFDEDARNLTLMAARQAGFKQLTLLEEPLAAFYAWIAEHHDNWQNLLPKSAEVLVLDCGGGTTDFSIIRLEEKGVLRRTAVGEHLLLGGDNMDMTLARLAEKSWGTRLSQRQWSQLCQECRRAKEALLASEPAESYTVQITGSGSSLLAGLRTHAFTREELLATLLRGFFPTLALDSSLPTPRRGMQEMGLPYAAEPAITRHLLAFLRHAGTSPGQPATPTHVLFNGGAMLPAIFRQQICRQLGAWQDRESLPELPAIDLSLAVSRGAAYYGLARSGRGVRVKGGTARAFFLQIDQADASQALLCVMPRDVDEGVVQRLPDRSIFLRANQPVVFPLHASATRLGDRLGDIIPTDAEGITALPPLHTALRFGRKTDQTILNATISSQLNEIGTLDVWCEAPATGHRFPLSFDLRQLPSSATSNETAASLPTEVTIAEHQIQTAFDNLRDIFRAGNSSALPSLNRCLEESLALSRWQWHATLLRRLADLLLANGDWRRLSPAHEARWLNLTGFCLRPGCGVPGDEWRLRHAWKLWHGGPLANKNAQVQSEWWIFWRRLAAGLRSGQQDQVIGTIARAILTPQGANAMRGGNHPGQEQWRLAASLEKASLAVKTRFLQALLQRPGKLDEVYFWVIARLGARQLFHGTLESVVPGSRWSPLFRSLLQKSTQAKMPRAALFAIANTARMTGMRTIDLPEQQLQQAQEVLQKQQAPPEWQEMVTKVQSASEAFQDQLAGESLPLGLLIQTETSDER